MDNHSRFEGFLDNFDGRTFKGWAHDRTSDLPIEVDVYKGGALWKSVVADKHRPDLETHLPDSPNRGFELDLEDAAYPHLPEIVVTFGGSTKPLTAVGSARASANLRSMPTNELIQLRIHDPFQPQVPEPLIKHVGGHQATEESFRVVGAGLSLELLRFNLIGLAPCRVIDLGCGCGRVGLYLGSILSNSGSYHGYDTWKEGIDWARENVTSVYPHVEFSHLTHGTKKEDKVGYVADGAFELSRPDGSCDLAIATSVFTHLTHEASVAYLKELSRLLSPYGMAYLTFFLWDEESAANLKGMKFHEVRSGYRFDHPEYPDFFFREKEVEAMFEEAGLAPVRRELGFWRGEKYAHRRPIGYQDLFILRKK